MKALPFQIVDVFTDRKYAGNQLAVVLDSAGLSAAEMQDIAREMYFSETTFLLSREPRDGGYDVRIFTPAAEVPFAGHPTLGTAYVIQREIIGRPVEQINLNLACGRIPVAFSYRDNQPDLLWMTQNPPVFGPVHDPAVLEQVLSLEPGMVETKYPVQEVSTGLPFILVPLVSLAAIKRARVNREAYDALLKNTDAQAIFLFCPEAYHPENQINARMFADALDVPEDPATGSACGCLAGYLVQHRYFGTDRIEARVEQGYEINRPSLLLLKAALAENAIRVEVGGRVVPTARGELI